MSAKHTPGPWAYRSMKGYCTQIDGADGHTICCFDEDPSEADAKLITAAPDLLAVAELLALATDEGDDLATGTHYIDKTGRIRCKGSFLDTIERARAAIEKATGEQP